MIRPIGIAAIVLAGLGWPAWAEEKAYQPKPKGSLAFNKDVARIIFKNCSECHRPGEVAPFALLAYRDVQKRAEQIAELTSARQMPPWLPLEGHGHFRNERRLSVEDVGILKQWAEEGAIEGAAKDKPPAPVFPPDGWKLGKPDLIAAMPKAFKLHAEGRDVFRNFIIPVQVPTGKYVKAVEFRPSNRKIVHHAGLSIDVTGKYRERDGQDGAPGFNQGGFADTLLPGNLGLWVPGKESRPLPDGMAVDWPAHADFLIQLHLHPSGKPEEEQSSIAFYFTSEPPRRRMTSLVLIDKKIDIPPGEKAYPTRAEKTVERDSELLCIFPHMHWIGKESKVTAHLPDGTQKSLLKIDRWDFNWQNYYEYVEPISLPAGTRVVMENTHDNSADNPANPNHPPIRVVAGEQTTNEMSIVMLNLAPVHSATARAKPIDGPGIAEEAKRAIQKFDADGDGKLSVAEIEKVPAAAKLDVRAVVKRFDKDGDGKLDAKELAEAIAALRQK